MGAKLCTLYATLTLKDNRRVNMNTYNKCQLVLDGGTKVPMPVHRLEIDTAIGEYRIYFLNAYSSVPIGAGNDYLYKCMQQLVEIGRITDNLAHLQSKYDQSTRPYEREQLEYFLQGFSNELANKVRECKVRLEVDEGQFPSDRQYRIYRLKNWSE